MDSEDECFEGSELTGNRKTSETYLVCHPSGMTLVCVITPLSFGQAERRLDWRKTLPLAVRRANEDQEPEQAATCLDRWK